MRLTLPSIVTFRPYGMQIQLKVPAANLQRIFRADETKDFPLAALDERPQHHRGICHSYILISLVTHGLIDQLQHRNVWKLLH